MCFKEITHKTGICIHRQVEINKHDLILLKIKTFHQFWTISSAQMFQFINIYRFMGCFDGIALVQKKNAGRK